MRTVCESKAVQSPLTSAVLSSFSESWPVAIASVLVCGTFYELLCVFYFSLWIVPFLSTALNSGNKVGSWFGLGGAGLGGGRETGGGRFCKAVGRGPPTGGGDIVWAYCWFWL